MTIIDGRTIAAAIRARVKTDVATLGRTPGLGVVLVGTDPASVTYVRLKERACAEVGIRFARAELPETAAQNDVLAAVRAFNARADIDAMLVQLPLPAGMDQGAVIQAMDPAKDVDGYHPKNLSAFIAGTSRVTPVVVSAILKLLTATQTALAGKHAVLFANSLVFADPLRAALERQGARVSAHLGKEGADVDTAVTDADVVVVAVGKPKFLRAVDCKDGAVIIDVVKNWLPDGSYVGDVDAAGSAEKPGWLSPVPGGVGPVTVATLTENVLALSRARG